MGLSKELSCEAGSFSHWRLNPQGVLNQWFEALFPCTGALGLRGLFHSPFVPPSLSAHKCGTPGRQPPPPGICQLLLAGQLQPCPPRYTICCLAGSASHHLAESSPPSCVSPPLLRVWMNVPSLTPWLLDFHTVRFSVSSGCFLFLNCCCPSFGCARRHSVST